MIRGGQHKFVINGSPGFPNININISYIYIYTHIYIAHLSKKVYGLIHSGETQRPEVAMIIQILHLKVNTFSYQNYWNVIVTLPYPTHHLFSEGDETSTG